MIVALSIASLLAAPHSVPAQIPISHAEIARKIFAKKPCGDHSIISDRAKADVLDRRCKQSDTDDIMKLVQGTDGKHEARQALARGDYRLGAVWPDFPPRPGDLPFETPGVECPKAVVANVAVFSRLTTH